MNWHANETITDLASDVQVLIECCQVLKLDLICIQSKENTQNGSGLKLILSEIEQISQNGIFVFWVVNGAFQTAMEQRGMMSLLMNIADSPEDVCKELRFLSEHVIATMAKGVKAGAHGVIIADDIAYRQSTYMSPDFVEQYFLPIWQAQVAAARNLDIPVFFHSDGNINAVLPHILAAGFDGLQCIEPAAGMDFKKMKKKYGKELCLMGNVDPSLLSTPGRQGNAEKRRDRLRRAVSDLMASGGVDGGFIFGTCSGLYAGMSPALVYLMYHWASELDTVSDVVPPL